MIQPWSCFLHALEEKEEHLCIFTRILYASLGTGIEVLCSVRSCLLLCTSHTSSISDRELVVQTARRWSCDQASGCSPLTGDRSGTAGSRLTGTFSGTKSGPSSVSGSVLIITFWGSESTGSDGLAAAMFSAGWKWRGGAREERKEGLPPPS